MAADCRATAPDSNESDEEKESLNVYSKKFDPLKALYSNKIVLPRADAPVADNLAVYASRIAAKASGSADKTVSTATSKEKTEEEVIRINEQRWLPHQRPVRALKPWVPRNVFTRMTNEEGPVGCLRNYMDKRLRIKVVTRNDRGIRGYCIGYLQAFDKQWNLAMSDVLEVWTRRRKKKVPAGIGDLADRTSRLSLAVLPTTTTRPAGKGLETCERHVPQLVMRGEHVVLVVMLAAR